ncbi:hypothetical protein PIB30_065838 [Stylosanthes scabra]|uniref:Glutamic acid-rich protein-like n=1 Tax=Stylosanthes scabra TaxID=79078 RepID=A0ABU6SMH8_9FABA|nr:hypothetical protein [Stylosanthes scabra]
MIKALIRELLQKIREEEGLGKKEKEKDSKEKCRVEQKSYKKGEEKSQVDCLSVTEMLNEMEQILYHDKGADAHLMAPRKVYPPPSHFSRRLAALRARQARDKATNENVAPHNNEVVDISSDSDSEQVPEYVTREEAGIEEEDEDIPEYVPGAEPMGEEEDPEEDSEEDPEEEPQEEQPEAMEQNEDQEEVNHGEDQEMAFGWANHEEEEEEEEEEDKYFDLLDLDDFVDYWELAPPPSPLSDDDE